uniref:NADH dehydrogenase I subunit F n=1 Tax=uncultured prokaryote TaxID=198431 RepID=H5SP84_9ZZZZ|nr:NADH dehydrogenase I subunit F [uncultured prokaryote]
MELLLTKRFSIPDAFRIDVYKETGGYQSLKKALQMRPEEIIEEVKKANLRGRGGAGFPAGVKWGFLPKERKTPVYLCINADEGEPGTFKDRYIMLKDPHLLIEGIVISSYAIGANKAFVYVRGEFVDCIEVLGRAIDEAYREGILGERVLGSNFSLDVIIHRGAGAYICGEETALIESLEGKTGKPRLKPPFPAQKGLYQCPTIVNNVETIACVPYIVEKGGEWFANLGTEKNGGTKLYAVSGHVKRPGVYELPMGTVLRQIIYEHAGGIINDLKLKAVIPGGSSSPVLTADEIDVKMDFDSLARIGSMLGSGAVIVISEAACMVRTLYILARFYAHESCGQCTPCRHGTSWMKKIIERIENGRGRREDLDILLDVCDNIKGKTICPLGDAAVMPVESFIKKFRDEFEEHIELKGCRFSLERQGVLNV